MITAMKTCATLAILALVSASAPSALSAVANLAQPPAVAAPQNFPTAEEAVKALVEAVRADRLDVVAKILGPSSGRILNSGDPYADAQGRRDFLASYDEQHKLVPDGPDRIVIQAGKSDWPLPIPLIQANGSWHFDTEAGLQELINRRIGRNEIAAVRTSLAYVDAQKLFSAMAKEVEGAPEYAQELVSTPGRHDGLYWPSEEGQPDSPLAPLMAQAVEEGYPGERIRGKRVPYHGYYFRILTGQGTSAAEGARNYVKNGRMTGGFALVAWPATYGTSGIMSFVVNQNGIVFQKDLGPNTASIAAAMKLFDPDLSWARIDIVND